jgi:hypothetical protein
MQRHRLVQRLYSVLRSKLLVAKAVAGENGESDGTAS